MSDRYTHRNDRGDHGRGGYRDNRRNSGGYRRDYDNRRNSGGDRDNYRGGGARGGRGGGGHDRRPQHHQQQQQKQRYQSSFVGQKRGRDEAEAVDPQKQFVKRLMRLGEPGPLSEGDKTNAGDSPEKTIDNALWAFKQEIKHQTPQLIDTVLEAVVSCSHKTLHYALLLGLMNAEDPDWIASFVAAAGQRFEQELQAGEVVGPRLLLRLFACLTHAAVLHPNDVLGLMERTVDVAMSQVAAGRDPSGLTWQAWSDQLVHLVLGALVWGGPQLKTAAAEEHESLMQKIQQYMDSRPVQESVELRPMYGADGADDAAAASDSGGASFLGQLWHAVQVLRQESQASQQPQQQADPDDPDAPQHEEDEQPQQQQLVIQGIPMELLVTFKSKLKGQAVELPPINLPVTVPGVTTDIEQLGSVGRAEVAVRLQDRYPARGGMRILEPQYTDGTRGPLERFVAEEMIIDLLVAFDAHRVELAQMLCSSLPLPYDYSGLLCETLFAQLLRLPSPRLSPVAFSALIAHTALLRPAFPRYLAGSVRQLYLRLQFLAPELAGRLADVLAHFISNMSFRWPWDKYRMGLSQPPGGPQRSFLVAVLHDLVKLTSWDHQLLLQETPADFLALLGQQPAFAELPAPVPYPPAPAPPPLPAPPAAPEQQQNSAEPEGQDAAEDQQDEQMADADGERDTAADGDAEPGAGDDADAADAMQQDEQQQEPQQEGAAASEQHQQANGDAVMSEAAEKASKKQQDPEQLWAGKLLGVMQSRPPPERKPLTYEQVLEWIDQQQMAQQLKGPEAHFRAVVRAVLAAGSKSCSHCYVLIERYSPYLFGLMQQLEQQQQEQAVDDQQQSAQEMLLELLWEMYSRMPRRLNLAIARLHEVSLLSPSVTVKWLTAHPSLQFGPAVDEAAAADAWQLLDDIIAGAMSRYQGALEEKSRLDDAVNKARAKLTAASEESAAAAEAQQRAEAEGGGADAGADGDVGQRKRQAISWPGTGGRHGAAHRVEVAALREELMAKRLATAEELLNQQDQQITGLEEVRGQTLLTAYKGLIPRLLDALVAVAESAAQAAADAGLDAPDDAMAAEGAEQEETPQDREERRRAEVAAAAESAKRLCLAQMEGFSRSHRSQVVELGLTDQLMQHVDSMVLGDDVRTAVLGPLHLS